MLDHPHLGFRVRAWGDNHPRTIPSAALDVENHPAVRGLDVDESVARVLNVPQLASVAVAGPLLYAAAVLAVHFKKLAAGGVLNFIAPRPGITILGHGCAGGSHGKSTQSRGQKEREQTNVFA